MLRLSKLFLRTLRDDPADAEVPSHKLLVRAGYVRRVAPGIYSWLPLGLTVLRNVEEIVRSEMVAMGAQEVHFPAMIPRETFEASGRWNDYGDSLFRLVDRKGADYLLGPTHEELFTLLVKGEYASYKDYPVTLFQIQTKFRDEARPRAGILRGREFVMKDSYSFDLDDDGLAASYQAHRDTYEKIFTRLGFDYRIVFAVSGAMGGSASEEFLAPTPAGEDTFVQCTDCDYAANTEAVEIAGPPPQDGSAQPQSQVLDTPDTPTIATLVERLNSLDLGRSFDAADTLKNVVLKTRAPGQKEWDLLVVGVPGDREVDLKRLSGQLEPVEVEQASAADLATQPGLIKGYIGPQNLSELKVRYLVDPLVVEGSAWVTGANVADQHAVFVVRGRDFTPDGEIGAVEIRDGDRCARCGGTLQIARGIELGHVFQLGRKYAEVFGLSALGANGKPSTITMGSYGVGITRAVAALAEQTLDEKGLCWPREVAPADVHVVAAGKDDTIIAGAEQLAEELEAAGLRVLLDDRRGVSPGVKFKDSELLGVPTILVVGRGLVDGTIELKDRRSDERSEIARDQAVAIVSSIASPTAKPTPNPTPKPAPQPTPKA
ncbi:prolyl-tRNA synthetase [Jatrophihabitans sp. GAS493]|uniref:proline--tRNA ligase n=1 Tax=Jatrophihabitans sp. GAS493 TaxID=1907575 RepID=UPI000BBFA67F|nr:proline--tRNA ligase [Jatrophihabitans sp. GAS493]SOD74027.1 prolyl-tRNA synthetase [Jatrophihabitans sp. GAS493]